MPNTLIPIQTYTLTGNTTSITFSNIPQNYTDLKVVASLRADSTQNWGDITFNGGATAISMRHILNNGGSVISQAYSPLRFQCNTSSYTANTFSNAEMYVTNYTSSSSKSISMDGTQETNGSTIGQHLAAGLWASSSAVTSITITPDGGTGTFVAGSTVTLYGVSNGVKAVGGTLTVAGGYAYHTFTSTGSFLPSQQIKGAEVLMVAGGGGGGYGGGGGGAGGINYVSYQTLNAGNTYTALVGAGGAGGTPSVAPVNGSNSILSSISATGGGGGGQGAAGPESGQNGGSGGGARRNGSVGTGVSGQGNNGGTGNSTNARNGGGGGAGAVGSNFGSGFSGAGGIGSSTYSVFGSVTNTGVLSAGVYYYAGGGGGGAGDSGAQTAGAGGVGGGGTGGAYAASGAAPVATAGTANTGGGGGGGGWGAAVDGTGGAGGSGLVIVRYRLD
jgi:hypothetical protein